MTTLETPKEFQSKEVAPIDTKFDATAGELENLEGDESGKVTYLRESKDGNYSIYKYILASEKGGNKGGIRKKFESQIGVWVEGTQFTDVNGNELKQDWFKKGETVYLRVPKNKETKNNPGKVEYVGNKKDKENRSRKYYSYTFVEGGNTLGVMNKWENQLGYWDLNARFCDEDGNKLQEEWFDKGETIYIKVPNTDIIDPTPEMSMDEIMSLSDEKMRLLFRECENYENSNTIDHKDKRGYYTIIEGRKVYLYDFNEHNNTPYFNVEVHESAYNVYNIAIFKKVGDKLEGVFCDGKKVYRGNLIRYDGGIYPENYFEN